MPRVSVVAYVYDYADYLGAALDSILAQSYRDFELFVLDDGSEDGTAEVVASRACDTRLRYERQEHKGRERLHETFNRCLRATSAPLVAIANGDDVMLPRKLERQVELLDARPEIDVSLHEAHFIDGAGRERPGRFHPGLGPEVLETGRLGPYMFERDCVPNPSALFRRAIVERIGAQEYGWTHDYQFWLKAAVAACRFHFLPEPLLRYRVHERSHSTSSGRLARLQDEDRRMRREMRARYTIDELYPEIARCRDAARARADAHLDLGLRLAGGALPLYDLAVREFERAETLDSSLVEARANRAALAAPGGAGASRVVLFRKSEQSSELLRLRAEPPRRAPARAGELTRGIAELARLV